jgi:hypothetical protein
MLKCVVVAGAMLLTLVAGGAQASPESNALGKCLVDSSTGKDRVVFVQWLFAALSANPDVAPLASITPNKRTELNHQAAEIVQRLIITDCHKESVAAIRQDGDDVLSSAFEQFGRVAAQELMSDPSVGKAMASVGDNMDRKAWASLEDEAKK